MHHHQWLPSEYEDYLRCEECQSLKHVNPSIPKETYTSNYWGTGHVSTMADQVYNLNVHQENGVTKNQYVLDRLPQFSHKLLEVGCAPGSTAHELLFNDRVGAMLGIEYDRSFVDDIRNIAGQPIPLIIGEFPKATYALKNESFATVLALDVFEHSFYPKEFLEESHRLLGRGGMIFLMLPLVKEDGRLEDNRFRCPEHTYLWSERAMREMLEEVGFSEPIFGAWCPGHNSVIAGKL
jgi:SAM-dependent methyltransferase